MIRKLVCLTALVLALAACGKRGAPTPPVPIIPQATSDLVVTQRGPAVILTWSFPSMTTAGTRLPAIGRIAVYRYRETLPASLVAELSSALDPSLAEAGKPREISLFERVPQIMPTQFEKLKTRIDSLEADEIPKQTVGAKIVYSDTSELRSADGQPYRYTYAIVTELERDRSEVSNLISIVPLEPSVAPAGLRAVSTPPALVLEWEAPSRGIAGGEKPSIVGYNIYRFPADGDIVELGAPVNPSPVTDPRFSDVPPFGSYRYVVTAVASQGPPKVESEPTATILATYEDRLAPPAPAGVTVLFEGRAVRLIWEAVDAPDFAGHRVYRIEGGARKLLTPEPIRDLFFTDLEPPRATSVSYGVTSVDEKGNESDAAITESIAIPRA